MRKLQVSILFIKKQNYENEKNVGGLLVAVALVMGGCTKENDEPAPAPTFAWTTDMTADAPVFVVPDAASNAC